MPRWTRVLDWGLPLAVLVVGGYLVLDLWVRLSGFAGGRLPLEARLLGYSLAEARGFLRALPPAGYVLAQGQMFWVDTLFSALLGLTLAWWMRPYSGVFGMVCVLSVMTYVALEWGENAALQAMFEAGPDWVRPVDIVRASTFTMAKFAGLGLAIVLAARQGWRRIQGVDRGTE